MRHIRVWWRRRAFHIDWMPKHGREAGPNQASGFTLLGANSFTPPQSASLRFSPRSPRMRLKPLGYAHQPCHQRPGSIYRSVHLDTALRCTHFPNSRKRLALPANRHCSALAVQLTFPTASAFSAINQPFSSSLICRVHGIRG